MNQKLISVQNFASRFTLDALIKAWRIIDPRYKQSFSVLMVVNLAVFSYGMVHHAVGDHDLLFFNGYPAEIGYLSGRWFQGALNLLAFNTTAPIYIQLLTIVFQVLAAMSMIILWTPQAGIRELVLGGLVVCLMPFVSWHHYYRSSSYFFSFPQLTMILALVLCTSASFNWKKILAGILLVTISLATYNPAVQTYAVGWAGLLCLRLSRWDGTGRELVRVLKSLAPSAMVAVAGGLLYYATALWLTHQGLMDNTGYLSMSATRSPAEMLAVIPEVIAASLRHLRYSQQFLPASLKSFLLLMVYLGLFCLILKAWSVNQFKLRRLLAVTAAVALVFLCSKLVFVIIQGTGRYYAERIAQMGLSYVYLFFILAALDSGWQTAKELCSFFLILVILPYMSVCNLRAQETFVLLAQHDFAVANRVLAKMESRLGAGLGSGQYAFVQLGSWKSLNDHLNNRYARIKPYPFRTLPRTSGKLVFHRLSAEFEPKSYYTISSSPDDNPPPPPDVVQAAGLAVGQKPFPDDDFIGVYGDVVVLLFDSEARDDVLRRAAVHQ